jgi:Flp pilus assembly protein TadG
MSGLVARLRRHIRQRTLGQSFVEFALILPIFLLFLAATIDLGRVFYANITLNNAAREGAFQAAQTPQFYDDGQPCDQATNKVVCRVQNETVGSMISIQPDDIDMTCQPASCPEAEGATVTVDVEGEFRLITPILSFVFGGQNLHLASSATAQIEYLPYLTTSTPPPPPVAHATVTSPTSGDAPLTVTFDATSSTGDPSGYQWDFNGDEIVDSTDPMPSWTFTQSGSYTVTLTVVNLTDVDVYQFNVTITAQPTPTPTGATPTPTVTPSPSCAFPPDVMGHNYLTAAAEIQAAGFTGAITWVTLSSGPKLKIQAQNPDHTQCLPLSQGFQLAYRPN